MARYYLHLRDHSDETLDPEGVDLPDLDAVKEIALISARDILSADLQSGGLLDLRLRIDAEDRCGKVVHSLAFEDAFQTIPRAA
ncbi:MAG: hypothetical protein EON59_02690 [Alphaproteobacteria bacterium]|nr:MAG: hypothetical protein EON59_02690 [Alphaproteobacteria bacterium]